MSPMRGNGRMGLFRAVMFGCLAIVLRWLSNCFGRAADHFGRRAKRRIGSDGLCPVCRGRGLLHGVECDTCLATGAFMDPLGGP